MEHVQFPVSARVIEPVVGVQQLKPYQPGKPIEELERELGISPIIKLASNENPLGPSPIALSTAMQQLTEMTRYPDGTGYYLKEALSHHLSVSTDQITLGNGSNDVLELVARAYLAEGDEVIYSEHAFAVYGLVSQAINANRVVTPAKGWGHDLDAMAAAVSVNTKMIFIANPNNPTGTYLTAEEIKAFLAKVPPHVIVVMDEAYHEYQTQADYQSAINELKQFPNLFITRTFSKVYGLAAIRVGYSVSSAEIADNLNRIRQPFNVNSVAQAVATTVLEDEFYLEQSIQANQNGLQQLYQGFEGLNLSYIPSVGNFVCVDFDENAMPYYQALLKKGVIVRPIANYNMPNHLRVSVGTEAENQQFIHALSEVMNHGIQTD